MFAVLQEDDNCSKASSFEDLLDLNPKQRGRRTTGHESPDSAASSFGLSSVGDLEVDCKREE